ncbi:MAG TPA: histidine phosphatase family protein [Propionibacteriaceae bacterium]|nr:histidine phosphatase family protein [Propionibacteriaceae bacterium]
METSGLRLILIRHGETEWARDGRHTGRTDVPLTELGRLQATVLGDRLRGRTFGRVLTSPLARASETCRLAGVGEDAEISDDLMEWDYGEYEGRRTAEIRQEVPGWSIWRDGVPGGESAAEVGARADRVIADALATDEETVLFAHGHYLRVLTARWVGLPPENGRLFALAPATIGVLGYEREQRVIVRWNDRCHLVLPSYVWEEQGDLDVRPGDPSVGSGDDREKPRPGKAPSPDSQVGTPDQPAPLG